MRVMFLSLTLLLSSCAAGLWGEPASEIQKAAPSAGSVVALPPPSTSDALELRIAQLWTKVDALEAQILQQKERSRLLEKGLRLGIVPEELRGEDDSPRTKAKDRPLADAKGRLDAPVAALPAEVASKNEGSQDIALYRKSLQEAQDKFNRANYGQAIVAFNDIGSKFDDSITEGNHHYWVGLSWFYLKEYKLAEESFTAFRERYPGNPWSNHAAFYLAKIEQSRGLNKKALEQFQKILDTNTDRDLGEMARAEIERMKEKL